MTVEEVAKICHEVNRAYSACLGDSSHLPWEEAPSWQKESCISGVKFHLRVRLADAGASHREWMATKIANGWIYGATKDETLKTHPCMVPFEELPREQQLKDVLFKEIVDCFRDVIVK